MQSFSYDAMDRLVSAQASGGTMGIYAQETYGYSATTGNLASKAGISYTYGDSDHVHAVTGLSNGNSYSYDANGNMTGRIIGSDTYTLTYDIENHMTGVSGAATEDFQYNGDGQRVVATVGITSTVFISNYAEYDVSSGDLSFYYYAGAARVAMRDGEGELKWLLGDHLGSTSVAANEDGTVEAEQNYMPWGETRFVDGDMPTDYQYTGQFRQQEIGLYFYNSRWFDPQLGRFSQPDTIIPGMYHVQSFDRYAYVLNNSLRYTDPSGYCPNCQPYIDGYSVEFAVDHANEIGECPSGQNPTQDVSDPGWRGYMGTALIFNKVDNIHREEYFQELQNYCQENADCQFRFEFIVREKENGPLIALVVTGTLLTVAVITTEILLIYAELGLVPVVVGIPWIGVPLEAVLFACSTFLLDFDIAYWAYVYRVAANPYEKQYFEWLPPWGL